MLERRTYEQDAKALFDFITIKEKRMSVRAKFRCTSITIFEGESREYSFSPVYGADGSANADWSKWTPNGSLQMTINNPACFDKFETGREYYLDFTPAEEEVHSVTA